MNSLGGSVGEKEFVDWDVMEVDVALCVDGERDDDGVDAARGMNSLGGRVGMNCFVGVGDGYMAGMKKSPGHEGGNCGDKVVWNGGESEEGC
jgi:hypothetical protein